MSTHYICLYREIRKLFICIPSCLWLYNSRNFNVYKMEQNEEYFGIKHFKTDRRSKKFARSNKQIEKLKKQNKTKKKKKKKKKKKTTTKKKKQNYKNLPNNVDLSIHCTPVFTI